MCASVLGLEVGIRDKQIPRGNDRKKDKGKNKGNGKSNGNYRGPSLRSG
jgi:hypothetical protein